MHHLIDGLADAVASNNSLNSSVLDVANDLEERLQFHIIALSRAVEHVDKLRFVNFHGVSPLGSGLLLSQTNTTNWRMTENDGGDVIIVHFEIWLVVKDSLRDQTALSDSHWSKIHLVGHITNSIDARNICVLEFINLNGIFLNHNTGILKVQWLKIWRSSKSTKDGVCLNIGSITEVDLKHSIVQFLYAIERSLKSAI